MHQRSAPRAQGRKIKGPQIPRHGPAKNNLSSHCSRISTENLCEPTPVAMTGQKVRAFGSSAPSWCDRVRLEYRLCKMLGLRGPYKVGSSCLPAPADSGWHPQFAAFRSHLKGTLHLCKLTSLSWLPWNPLCKDQKGLVPLRSVHLLISRSSVWGWVCLSCLTTVFWKHTSCLVSQVQNWRGILP